MKAPAFPTIVFLLASSLVVSSQALLTSDTFELATPLVHLVRNGVEIGSFSNLEDALLAAFDDDEVVMDAGVFSGIENRDLQVTKNLTIRGAGRDASSIDCSLISRAFQTHDSEVLFQGFTIIRGNVVGAGNGGGVDVKGGEVTFEDMGFRACFAQRGGGVSADFSSSVVLRSCEFLDNSAVSGGGLAIDGGAEVAECEFTSNRSLQVGGAVFVSAGAFPFLPPVTIVDSRFTANSGMHGGAIAVLLFGLVTIDRCTFLRNDASEEGGGLSASILIGDCVVKNSLFAQNAARFGAGGISGRVREIVNCTIVENQTRSMAVGGWAPGGVRCGTDGNPTLLLNSIVRDNVSGALTTLGQQVSATFFPPDPEGLVIVSSNIEGLPAGSGNFDANPLFVDPMADDYHILPGSPCENTGMIIPTSIGTLDLDREPRVQGSGVDVGSDEITRPLPFGPRRMIKIGR